MSVVKTASTTHPVQTFKQPDNIFFASKVIGKFFDVQKCVFHSFFRTKKDLAIARKN